MAAQFVAKGFIHNYVVVYLETFSPHWYCNQQAWGFVSIGCQQRFSYRDLVGVRMKVP